MMSHKKVFALCIGLGIVSPTLFANCLRTVPSVVSSGECFFKGGRDGSVSCSFESATDSATFTSGGENYTVSKGGSTIGLMAQSIQITVTSGKVRVVNCTVFGNEP